MQNVNNCGEMKKVFSLFSFTVKQQADFDFKMNKFRL